jgi:hypothetical protein
VIAVGNEPTPQRYEELFETVEPEMTVTVIGVDTWSELREQIQDGVRRTWLPPEAREGSLGWASELQRLPEEILDALPESVVVLTPRREDSGSINRFIRLR